MYKTILVPVVFDHEPAAEESIQIAKSLLKSGGKILLLHVVEEIPGYVATYLPADSTEKTMKECLEKLNAISDKAGATVTSHVVEGHASRTILQFGEENAVDCIVVASHKPGVEDYLIGSTAARVVRHAKCAVHVHR